MNETTQMGRRQKYLKYTGCNRKIEQIKYFEKHSLDQKVKKYVFNVL